MFCMVQLEDGDVVRAPTNLCPRLKQLESQDTSDRVINAALTQMVSVKQEVSAVHGELEDVLRHLEQSPEDEDARRAIAQVEGACVLEQMQRVLDLAESDECVSAVEDAILVVEGCNVASGPSVELDPNCALVCQAQWLVIKRVGKSVFEDLLPQAVALIAPDADHDIVYNMATLMSTLESKVMAWTQATEQAVQRFDSTFSKLLAEPNEDELCRSELKLSFKNEPGNLAFKVDLVSKIADSKQH